MQHGTSFGLFSMLDDRHGGCMPASAQTSAWSIQAAVKYCFGVPWFHVDLHQGCSLSFNHNCETCTWIRTLANIQNTYIKRSHVPCFSLLGPSWPPQPSQGCTSWLLSLTSERPTWALREAGANGRSTALNKKELHRDVTWCKNDVHVGQWSNVCRLYPSSSSSWAWKEYLRWSLLFESTLCILSQLNIVQCAPCPSSDQIKLMSLEIYNRSTDSFCIHQVKYIYTESTSAMCCLDWNWQIIRARYCCGATFSINCDNSMLHIHRPE